MSVYLYLVRHGQTVANATNTHAGHLDSPLTELGREQAAASAHLLTGIDFDTVFSSDLVRAKDTCAIFLPHHSPILRPDIREISVGALENQNRVTAREKYGDTHIATMQNFDYSAFGGESYQEFSQRVLGFLNEVATGQHGKHVIAFCHGGIIHVAVRHVLNCAEQLPPLAVTNCSVSVLHFNGQKWFLRAFNRTPDLPQ